MHGPNDPAAGKHRSEQRDPFSVIHEQKKSEEEQETKKNPSPEIFGIFSFL